MKRNIETATSTNDIAETLQMTQSDREVKPDSALDEVEPLIELELSTRPNPNDDLWDYSVCNF